MERTISVTIGQGCLKHNNRVFIAENVDTARLDRNVVFIERDIRAVYHELFDDAVEKYNARQKRKDQKIQNYYEKIKSGRQERLFTEAIVQIGNMKDSNCAMEEAELVKEILTEYMHDFEERNPSLKVFNAVLHMDETTPHIHATIVPIVMGERRKAKQKKQTEGKRTYRKKTDAARLCADDVLNRDRLVAYHDDYAKVMERYGLQRGVRGSEARHTTTAQYYRDLKRQTGELETDVQQLQSEKKAAEKRLLQIKREIGTERLEVVKTEAKTAIIAKVGSLLGSGEIKELKQENQQLRDEVVARDESIERLQIMMQYIHEHYAEEITLEMIAASASISKSGALHIFQSGIHCSPVAYLIQYRLAQAARQLYTTQKSVASIANETGFTSAGYFCRKFRQYYNRSPKEYRKKKTEESS